MSGKVLAIDYGKKMVGFAGGDLELGIAFPRDVIKNLGLRHLCDEVLLLCESIDADCVVIGMPSSSNPICSEIEKFMSMLKEESDMKIVSVDEDYTSVEAGQMFNGGMTRGVGRLDANAAQVILQRFFDSDLR